MQKLLPYHERELAILRSYMRELAQRFPRLAEIRMLRKPTVPLDLADHPEAHWQLVAIAHASQRNDAQQHGRPLPHLLRMHARPGSAVTERQLSGILGVSRSIFSEWIKHKKGCSLVKGYEIAITIDEAAFTERGITVLAKIMERVLAYYLLQFNFSRLNILGNDGQALVKGALVNGTQSPAKETPWNS